MSAPKQIVVTQADVDFVDEVTSTANLVTHDGYVEINTDAIILAAARFRIAATRAAEARIAGMVAESSFIADVGHYEGARIDSIDELLRLINGGARFKKIALATTKATKATTGEKG